MDLMEPNVLPPLPWRGVTGLAAARVSALCASVTVRLEVPAAT